MADRITFSSSVRLKYNSKIKAIAVNKLYSFNKEWTWADILHDITDPDKFAIDKLDDIVITVSDKIQSVGGFEPDINEQIKVVHEFDNKLKFVQFDIIRETPAASDANNNPPAASNTNAFEMLMSQSWSLSKIPSKIDVNAARFTGVYQ